MHWFSLKKNKDPPITGLILPGGGAQGRPLISYLLFEETFCKELIELGYRDAMQLQGEILQLLGMSDT